MQRSAHRIQENIIPYTEDYYIDLLDNSWGIEKNKVN